MINKVIFLGHVGRNPQVRSSPSGTPVASFSLAASRQWRRSDGILQEHTEWHTIVCFGRNAEVAGECLASGCQLYVEGKIQMRSWQDRHSSQTRYRTEIICARFQQLGAGTRSPRTPSSQGSGRGAERKDRYFGAPPQRSASETSEEHELDRSEPGPEFEEDDL
ncbi:MAG: single-stranded DNA-binding protein [bacterium]|nr:single-stranded DNA-binding protein [bacterium]